MGWFDEQIREREQRDRELFETSLLELSDAVTGKHEAAHASGAFAKSDAAVAEILRYFRLRVAEPPAEIADPRQQLEFLLRPSGVMTRPVVLEGRWDRDAVGPYLARRNSDGAVVALLPSGFSGYSFIDPATGKRVKVGKQRGEFTDAVAFYRPFPAKKLGIFSLLRYMIATLSISDVVLFALAALAVALVGLLAPRLQNFLFSTVLEQGSLRLVVATSVFLICALAAQLMISAIRSLLLARMGTKLSVGVQAATMMRVLSLPADFFRRYGAGELSDRAHYIGSLCDILLNAVFSTGLTSIFSLVYLGQIFVYAPALVLPALAVILVTLVFSLLSSFAQMRHARREMEHEAKASGLTYGLLSGVRKIKLAGAERRAFAKWAELHAEGAKLAYRPPVFLRYNGAFAFLISAAGMIALYFAAIRSGVSVADYYAFNTAYGMVSGAFSAMAGIALTAANLKPVFDMAKPILDTVPEDAEGKRIVTRLSGGFEIDNVTFRYRAGMPDVLRDLSLRVRPGEYVAIVGATGCGKSTLLRLLLGFEKPQKGAIYYDGQDLNALDLRSLRRRIGVVMQDGKLFDGDIFSNIAISAPGLTAEEAWRAAEAAGIADDIRAMPMGMATRISETTGGISGGQRQRILIARAIAAKPKLLLLDEATSSLDNLTQKRVADALASLSCTRLVVAHRLSTIRRCDRILFLEDGQIAEEGTFDALIARGGRFAALMERQRQAADESTKSSGSSEP